MYGQVQRCFFAKRFGRYSQWNRDGIVAKADSEILLDQAGEMFEGVFLKQVLRLGRRDPLIFIVRFNSCPERILSPGGL